MIERIREEAIPSGWREDLIMVAQIAAQAKVQFELAQKHIQLVCENATGVSLFNKQWSYDATRGIVTWIEQDHSTEKPTIAEGAGVGSEVQP